MYIMNTLIIYDWDDTLFPTTFVLNKNQLDQKELLLLEEQNIKILEKSRQLGRTIIITNASTQWIYNSSEQYMPNLYKYIKNTDIPIISAREYATARHIFDHEKWKDITFYNAIKTISQEPHNIPINNILSVGDAVYERNALHKYGQFINNKQNYKTYIKTIKYIDNPTPFNMINEATSLLYNIEYHIQFKYDLDINM